MKRKNIATRIIIVVKEGLIEEIRIPKCDIPISVEVHDYDVNLVDDPDDIFVDPNGKEYRIYLKTRNY